MNSPVSAIVALGKSTRAICHGQDLLWVIKDDHKRMKNLTMHHTLVMGRKTYESIGHPLVGRVNIIVTKNNDYSAIVPPEYSDEVVRIAHSSEEAMVMAREEESKLNQKFNREVGEIFIFGGAEIYQATFDSITRLYLTIVDDPANENRGTAYFPDYSSFSKKIGESESHLDHDPPFEYVTLERP